MKNFIKYFAIISAVNLAAVNFALIPAKALAAGQPTNLQDSFDQIKQSVQDVQEGTQNLITSKDDNNLTPEEKQKQELDNRLSVFGKILTLSINEATSTEKQLKALKNLDKEADSLRNQLVSEFDGFIKSYNDQKQTLEKPEAIDLVKIKEMAQSFKDWRTATYLPEFEKANDFLLINQQQNTLEMAGNRFNKITSDIKNLKKQNLKGVEALGNSLSLAANSLKEAENLYKEAENKFWLIANTLDSNASSTIASSTISSENLSNAATADNSSSTEIISPLQNASSTDINPTSTPSISIEDQFLSIKGLVGDSLNKIKETYQIFIEMSDFVKKLLI